MARARKKDLTFKGPDDAALRVVQPAPPRKPIEREILAEAIKRIGDGIADLNRNGVNRRAIVILLQAQTGVNRGVIEMIFDALPEMQRKFCR